MRERDSRHPLAHQALGGTVGLSAHDDPDPVRQEEIVRQLKRHVAHVDGAPLDVDERRRATSRGTFASDLTVIRTGPTALMVITGTAQAVSDRAWLHRHVSADEDVRIEDRSAGLAVLGVMGPRSRDLLSPLCDADLSHAAFPFATSRELVIAAVPCRAVRITYVGELGWEVYAPAGDAGALYDAIWRAGQPLGLVNGGHYAINSLRLEKGYRAWGSDLSMDHTPLEAGLGFAVAWGKSDAFLGGEALRAQHSGPPPAKRMLSFVLEDPEPVLWGGELIFRDRECVGYTTSGAYGHSLGASVALGYVRLPGQPANRAELESGRYQIDVAGRRFAARASIAPPFDPARKRILV